MSRKSTNDRQELRRHTSSVAVFLFVPFINYLFYFAIIRAAYMSVKNFHLFNKRNPSVKETLGILTRFVFHCTWRFAALAAILLFIFAWNPFGSMMSYYWEGIHDMFAGISPSFAISFFSEAQNGLSYLLGNHARSWETFKVITGFAFYSYGIFAIIGIFLGLITNIIQDRDYI